MGTRGLRVYRHKARYFVHYNQMDSYPDALGSLVLSEIPVGDDFEEWLVLMREQLDKELELWEASGRPGVDEQGNFPDWITEDRPESGDFDSEWLYEMDLDNLVFN
ncbi:hypothetical protein BOTBODRAFT_184379, partial [Botryobasidium botryosum FD-172 SS1]